MSGVAPASADRSAAQWPPQSPGLKPYPEMPAVPDDKPLLQSLGASGVAIFSGIITSEEYNPDFYWRDGIKLYEQMLRSDGQIRAIRTVLENPIKRAIWSIEPGSEAPRDKEIASFVESCLFHDMVYTTAAGRKRHQSWAQILHHILMHLWYGFMPFEVDWRVEDGWVKWAKWEPLLPRTIWRWWVGRDTELEGLQQWTFKDWNYAFTDIPADKLLLFVHQQEGANYEGLSVLRTAYKHWWYKSNFEKIEAIGIERNAVVPPVITLPENFTSADIAAAQTLGANMRASELGYATLPPGWLLEYPKGMVPFTTQVQPAIQYHDVMIARNVLAQFINLGSTETGAYALAEAQQEMFLEALEAVTDYICDVIDNDAIQRLVDYNFDNVEVYPRLRASALANADITQLADAVAKLKARDANFLTPDPEMEDYLREQMHFPKAARSVVQATNPTAESTPERPENENAADHSDQQSRVQTTNPQSAQVAQQAQVTAANNAITPASPGDGGTLGEDLGEDVRLLREAVESIAGLDVVERGIAHRTHRTRRLKGGEAARLPFDADAGYKLFNPYHDARGQFTTGGAGGAGVGGEHLARAQENHARAVAHHNEARAATARASGAHTRALNRANVARARSYGLQHGDAQREARARAKEALFQERLAKAQARNTQAYQKYKDANDRLPGLRQAEDRALNSPERQAAYKETQRIIDQARTEGKSNTAIARSPEYRAASARERELLNTYVRASTERFKAERQLESARKSIAGKYITEERISAHPLAQHDQAEIDRAKAEEIRANQLLGGRRAAYDAATREEAQAADAVRRAEGELSLAQGGSGLKVSSSASEQELGAAWHDVFGDRSAYSERALGALASARPGDTLRIEPYGNRLSIMMDGHAHNDFSVERQGNEVVLHTGLVHRAAGEERNINNAEDIVGGMRAMERLGVTRIETTAAGGGGFGQHDFNGYYTWARLGFTGKIESSSVRAAASAHFGKNITRVEQVMRQPGGPQWWKRNGDGFEARFSFKNRYSQAALRRFETLFTRQRTRAGATSS